jgi:hypothetical protein
MKTASLWTLLIAVGLLAGSQTAWAGGFSLGKLVPFANSNKAKASKKPSTFDQIGNGTKKVVHATTDLVTLKWLAPKPEPQPSGNRWSRRARQAEPEKKSFFSFLQPQEEPKQPMTLGEWMAQDRLDP